MSIPVAVISDRAKRRIKGKHPWIFSNELQTRPAATAGEIVEIQDGKGHRFATGYYNPHTLIAIRILSFNAPFDLRSRLQEAYAVRQKHYSDSIYRLAYGESDGLPGLIVDRYAQTLVVQILTAGMEKMQQEAIDVLKELLQADRILLRNDNPYRELEGLPQKVEWIYGEPLERDVVEMDELKFLIDFSTGQKGGFFLDQRENRKRLASFARAGRMLDAFAYTGAWSLYAAKAGMNPITAIDSSEDALAIARENARLNQAPLETIRTDVFEFLRAQYSKPERYDLIVLDPPAFAKSKRHLTEAIKGYREINLRAMKLLNKDGVLMTCSCSQPVTTDLFLEILRQAAADSGRSFEALDILYQSPDHPVLLQFPESHYLKCVVLKVR
jgi:23S rRNA (cytosine1962-C5)-methyltransferase